MSLYNHFKINQFNYFMIAFAIGFSYFAGRAQDIKSNYIPQSEQVEEGYVIPSKLEIKVKDVNQNGKDEVLMVYDGSRYLLKVDENGRPHALDFLDDMDKRLEIE